jgi:hypothetical protein
MYSAKSTQLISIANSLNPLETHFNRKKKEPQFLALLSPT